MAILFLLLNAKMFDFSIFHSQAVQFCFVVTHVCMSTRNVCDKTYTRVDNIDEWLFTFINFMTAMAFLLVHNIIMKHFPFAIRMFVFLCRLYVGDLVLGFLFANL